MLEVTEGTGVFIVRYFTIPPGGKSAFDKHRHQHGVVITHGTGRVLLGEQWHEVGVGDAVFIDTDEIHQLEATGADPLGFICVIPRWAESDSCAVGLKEVTPGRRCINVFPLAQRCLLFGQKNQILKFIARGGTQQPHLEVLMLEMLSQAKHILASQPFSVLLGPEILNFSPGCVELRVPVRPELLQQHGFVHGGVLSYAADNALTFVGGSVLGPAVVTSEFKINYLKPAVGDVVIARAIVVHQGTTQSVCRCDVLVGTGNRETLCAVAQGTIARLSRGVDAG